MPTLKTVSSRKAKRRDRLARWVITLGGVMVIASVAAILVMIASVTVPLFRPARAEAVYTCRLPDRIAVKDVLGLGIEVDVGERDATALVWTAGGTVAVIDPRTGQLRGEERVLAFRDPRGTVPFSRRRRRFTWRRPSSREIETVPRTLRHVEPLGRGNIPCCGPTAVRRWSRSLPARQRRGTAAAGASIHDSDSGQRSCGVGVPPAHAAGTATAQPARAGGTPAPQCRPSLGEAE